MTEERRTQTGIEVKLEFILKELDEIKAQLEKKYVSQSEFTPVKNIAYGMVGLILTAVVGSLLTLILK